MAHLYKNRKSHKFAISIFLSQSKYINVFSEEWYSNKFLEDDSLDEFLV